MVQENERLQNLVDDLRETSQQNKQLLDDYLSSIGDKESVISKLREEVNGLRERVAGYEQ